MAGVQIDDDLKDTLENMKLKTNKRRKVEGKKKKVSEKGAVSKALRNRIAKLKKKYPYTWEEHLDDDTV